MTTPRKRPTVAVSLSPEHKEYIQNQAKARGVSVSHVVSEAIGLMQGVVVYQKMRATIVNSEQPRTA